jgi:hypothetical protein
MIFGGDLKKVGPYVRALADEMGLRDWTINILSTPPDNDQHAACIDIRYGRKFANIEFARDWAESSPDTFRSTCVHELLHCHFRPIHWHINNLGSHIATSTFDVFYGAFRDIEEVAIDAVAEEWARHLPLPKVSKRGKA